MADALGTDARWLVQLGPCLPYLAALPDRSVDHVICDPPYSAHVHANSRSAERARGSIEWGKNPKRGISRGVDFGFESLDPAEIPELARQFERLARRWILVFSDLESAHLWRQGLEGAGAEYVRTMLWHKVGGSPQFSGDRPAVACEAITLAHVQGTRKRWHGGGKQGIYSVPIALDRGDKRERFHPTAKPLELMIDLVMDFTDREDLILDPYAGSGTTGAAALRQGRRFLGYERSPEHFTTARDRLRCEASGLVYEGSGLPSQRGLFEEAEP